MPKVSVIVPIYNAGEKLHKSIKSILSQTFGNFELILVNDGSIDNSLEICREYQRLDERIIVINKNNEGCIATRRRGIETSNSEYLMFVDADDWIDAKTIEILHNEAMQNDLDITVCNMYKVIGKGLFIKRKVKSWYFNDDKIYNEVEIKRDLVTAYFHGHPFPSSLCAKLYKRELIINKGKYLAGIKFLGEDLFYNLEILLKAKKLKLINKPFYYYRHGGFTSKYQPYLFDDMVNGYQIQKEVIEQYYQDTRKKQYNGISIMLLNTFKTCLYNLINRNLKEFEIKDKIKGYVLNENVIECTYNTGSIKYFSHEYLLAIRNKDIEYLYQLGESMYKRSRPRKILLNILSKIC